MRRLLVPVVIGPVLIGAVIAVAGCQGISVKLDTSPAKHSSSHSNSHGKSSPSATAVLAAGPVSAGSGALRVIAEPQAGLSAWNSAFTALTKAGAHVRLYRDSTKVIYIHAKAVVADAGLSDQQVYLGSENFSFSSLRRNRELGIRTTNKSVISEVSAVLAADSRARPRTRGSTGRRASPVRPDEYS